MESPQDVADAGNDGCFIDAGDGPKPATVDDLNRWAARCAVLHPKKVIPIDDEARELVRRERRNPETRRLVAVMAMQRRSVSRDRREPIARPREHRAGRTNGSRAPPRSGDDDPPPRPRSPLTRLERDLLKAEVDRRRRQQIAALADADRLLFVDVAEEPTVWTVTA